MGRNYRFFANLKVQLRRKLARELEQWKARNEAAAAASQKPKDQQTTPSAPATEASVTGASTTSAATKEMSEADKELAEASRFNLIL